MKKWFPLKRVFYVIRWILRRHWRCTSKYIYLLHGYPNRIIKAQHISERYLVPITMYPYLISLGIVYLCMFSSSALFPIYQYTALFFMSIQSILHRFSFCIRTWFSVRFNHDSIFVFACGLTSCLAYRVPYIVPIELRVYTMLFFSTWYPLWVWVWTWCRGERED